MNRTPFRAVVIPLVSLAVLVAVGYLAYNRISRHQVRPLDNSPQLVSETGRINVGLEDSSLLPANLPMPADAKVSESFDLATKDGDLQGTRSYESSRSLDAEFAAYLKYLSDGKWTVLDKQQVQGYSSVLAEKGGKQILASFSARNGTTYATVTALASTAH